MAKRKPNPKRVPVPSTYLSAEVYDKWSGWCDDRGIIQQSYMSKIIMFMMGLDNSTRSLFLEAISDEDRAGLAKMILERIAANGQAGARGGKGPLASGAAGVVARAKAQTPGGLGTRQSKKKGRSSKAG